MAAGIWICGRRTKELRHTCMMFGDPFRAFVGAHVEPGELERCVRCAFVRHDMRTRRDVAPSAVLCVETRDLDEDALVDALAWGGDLVATKPRAGRRVHVFARHDEEVTRLRRKRE